MDMKKFPELLPIRCDVGKVDWENGIEICMTIGKPPNDVHMMCRYPGSMTEEEMVVDFCQYIITHKSNYFIKQSGYGQYWRTKWEAEQASQRQKT